MKIEQSLLALSAQSSVYREQIRIGQPLHSSARVVAQARPQSDPGDEVDAELLMMRMVAEMMLGKRIHLFRTSANGEPAEAPAPAANANPQQDVQVRSVQVRAEGQQMRFHARGSVQTADGRQIEFESDLSLSRQFVEVVTAEEAPAAQQDPLVLNFDGKGVRLFSDRIHFDLDGDGTNEAIPLLGPGSGILFADRNGDGTANDGKELFGPQSGDGFGELSTQDSDGNGWIDESDPVFGELRVWFQDPQGPGATYNLKDLGVGAIFTSNVGTPFDLRNTRNALLGQIRSTGVYLREDGQTGTISHVDLTV